MGLETPEILRKNSEQPLVPGSPSLSLPGLLQARGRRRAQTARGCPQHRRCLWQRCLNPHTRCQRAPPAVRGLPGPRGSEAWAGSRRPPLRPLPGAAPAARPAAPHAGSAVPGRRTSSPWGRHIVSACGAPDTGPFGRSRTPSAPRAGRAAPARPRGAALGSEGPRAAAHHGGGCAGLSPPGSGGH